MAGSIHATGLQVTPKHPATISGCWKHLKNIPNKLLQRDKLHTELCVRSAEGSGNCASQVDARDSTCEFYTADVKFCATIADRDLLTVFLIARGGGGTTEWMAPECSRAGPTATAQTSAPARTSSPPIYSLYTMSTGLWVGMARNDHGSSEYQLLLGFTQQTMLICLRLAMYRFPRSDRFSNIA
jgi:hypothetical protein